MSDRIKKQIEKLSPKLQSEINDALHSTLCKTILKLPKDSMDNPGLLKEEIKSAREFAEMKSDSDEARELLTFLDCDEQKKDYCSLKKKGGREIPPPIVNSISP